MQGRDGNFFVFSLVYLHLGLALGLKGSAHGLAIGLTCPRVMNKKKLTKTIAVGD